MTFKNKEQSLVPDQSLPLMINGEWGELNTHRDFKGKRIIIFALPGAMTPTCSNNHLPKYDDLYEVFKESGIDEIYCLSVNDTFVMNSWAKELGIKNVKMMPDGNGTFTNLMGMSVDKTSLGFGERSWRYSMLIDDLTITKMFIEPDKDGDPYEVSDAITMLNYINPSAKSPDSITMLTREGCPYCSKAKYLLSEKSIKFSEIKVNRAELQALSGKETYPQVYINGTNVGGYEELYAQLS